MKLKRAIKKGMKGTLFFFQILPRNYYMKLLKKIYGDSLIFNGAPRFIAYDAYLDSTCPIYVGEGTTITSGCNILTHDYSVCYGATALDESDLREFAYKKTVIIGKFSFIGQRVTILPGVTIGDHVIVGSGSVVTKNLESYSVYAGNPAKYICSINEFYENKMRRDREWIS